jgi:CRISPR system Cascade subunit CasE
MYLSRLIVNPRDRAVRRDLGDCHGLHRTLLAAYPQSGDGDGARAAFGVLYRVETEPETGHAAVLVQSTAAPDWDRLPAGYLSASHDGVENPAVKTIDRSLEALRAGMRLRFRLRANPTRRVHKDSTVPKDQRMRGKRVDLRYEKDQIDWLERKGEAGGFRVKAVRTATMAADGQRAHVVDVRTAPQGRDRGRRPNPTRSRSDDLSFGAVLFDGELVVTDAEAFRRTLTAGIGSGKAYGFGLLSVAPAGG